jgi:hypothetical protein
MPLGLLRTGRLRLGSDLGTADRTHCMLYIQDNICQNLDSHCQRDLTFDDGTDGEEATSPLFRTATAG